MDSKLERQCVCCQYGGANVFKNPQRSSRILSSFNNYIIITDSSVLDLSLLISPYAICAHRLQNRRHPLFPNLA